MKKLIISILFAIPLFANQTKEAPSVVIIGGGPAGLSTAIEAHQSGCAVTIVEKRNAYSRSQTLFLLDSSLNLLEKWKVTIPQMKVSDFGFRVGFVCINHLEESLEKRVKELGINIIKGEFKTLSSNSLLISSQGKDLNLSYDILIAADGARSQVRDALDIPITTLGTGKGAFASIPHTSAEVDISPPIKQEGLFLRRMKVPFASIIFIQTPNNSSKKHLHQAIQTQGWHTEADLVAQDKALIGTDISIILQQAQTFSNEKLGALLIGDSAATASFFQGLGANTALKTAEIAGQFLKNYPSKSAYQNFNEAMKSTTDEMINDSLFLFSLSPEGHPSEAAQKP